MNSLARELDSRLRRWTTSAMGLVAYLGFAVCLPAGATAQPPAAPAKPSPQSTGDPLIAVDELNLLLLPLTKDELIVEADGWIGLLKAKTTEISKAEIAVKVLNRGGSAGAGGAPGSTTGAAPTASGSPPKSDEAAKAKADETAKEKARLLENLNKLRNERTAMVDRTRAVLTALSVKGGDIAGYEKYVAAVSGLNVDVKDASAAATAILGWLRSPQGGVRWAKNIVFFLVTLLVFKVVANVAGHAVRKAFTMARGGSALLQDFFVNSVRKVVLLVGVVVAVSMLEVNVGPLVAAIGAVGFVVGFALQGTLSNFAAGVMILLYRPYDLGDTVSVAGATGKVSSMTLVSTTIETADRKLVVVPNNSIWGAAIHRHLPS